MKSNSLRPHQTAILTAGVVSAVLWALPGLHWLMLPLQYLNTHLHELCHAVVARATGGFVQEIVVRADGSGVTPVGGGSILLSASAGYVGAAIIGAMIMMAAKSDRGAHWALRALCVALGFAMIIWVRGDAVGVVSGWMWIGVLAACSYWMKGPSMLFLAQFIGLQQCLYAFQSLYQLLRISAFTDVHNDASILQDATHVPAIVWALGWCLFSLAMVYLGLRQAWSPTTSRTFDSGRQA